MPTPHRQWLTQRKRHTPQFPQAQSTECGLGALGSMLAYWGRWVTLEELRAVTAISRDCLSAGDLKRAAQHYGLTARVLKREPEQLAALGLPLIIHLDFIHFAVLEAISEQYADLNDPALGPLRLARAIFDERFTGIAIALAPGSAFRRGGQRPAIARRLLASMPPPVRRLAAAGWLAQASLPLPLCLWLTSDVRHTGTAQGLGLGLGLAALGCVLLQASASACSQHAARLHSTALKLRLSRQLVDQPQSFFDYRAADALHALSGSAQHLAHSVHLRLLPATARLGAAIAGLLAAGLLAPGFGVAAAALCGITLACAALLCSPYRYRARDFASSIAAWPALLIQPAARLRTLGGDTLRATETGQLAEQISQRQLNLGRNTLLHGLPPLLALALLAATQLADRSLSAALLLLAIPACASVLPAVRLPLQLTRLKRTQLLLDDLPAPVEAAAPSQAVARGELVAAQLVFGYNRQRAPLLNGVSLTLAAGSITGLSGTSGGGKSTLALLLAGLSRPWSGTVSLGGINLAQLPEQQRAALIGWVDSQPFFTAGSLRHNLFLWQPPDPARLQQALDDAGASDIIASRPGGLDCAVEEAGRNFSGGQLQRLAIARALLHAPPLLILDEGSDSLDPALERQLFTRLRQRGCSVLVISHRAGTLAACDRVLHLLDGQLASDPVHGAPPPAAAALHTLPLVTPPSAASEPACLRACLRELMQWHGKTWHDEADGNNLAELASQQGLRLRAVRISVSAWWNADPGMLLVRQRSDGSLALLRRNGSAYLWSGGDGQWQPLAASPASQFEADAWTLDQPRAGRYDNWALGASSLALAILPLAGVTLATSASASPLLWILPAALLLHRQNAFLGARAAVRWQLSLLRQQQTILARLPGTIWRGISQRRLQAALDWARQCWPLPSDMAGYWPSVPLALATLAAAVAVLLARYGAVAAWALAPLLPLLWQLGSAAAQQRAQRSRARADQLLQSLLYNFTRLRACGTAHAALTRWHTLSARAAKAEARHDWRRTARLGWQAGCAPAGLALLGPAASPAGNALMLLALFQASLLMQTGRSWLTARASRHDLHRLQQLPAPPRCETAAPPWAIQANGLSWRYPGNHGALFKDITLQVRAGQITALAGASGSGKSTVLRLLLGLEQASAGTLRQHGIALARTAYITQGEQLALSAPLRWHLTQGAPWPQAAILAALRAVCFDEDLARMPMGLQTIVDSGRVSTGQLQRILLARALLQRPALLVLDEATSALPDPIQAQILRQIRAQGITCLLVSHRASALQAADHVIVLGDGRVLAAGAPSSATLAGLIGAISRSEQRDDVEIMPVLAALLPGPVASGMLRTQLFRPYALARFQGEGHRSAPLLQARLRHWPFWLLLALMLMLTLPLLLASGIYR